MGDNDKGKGKGKEKISRTAWYMLGGVGPRPTDNQVKIQKDSNGKNVMKVSRSRKDDTKPSRADDNNSFNTTVSVIRADATVGEGAGSTRGLRRRSTSPPPGVFGDIGSTSKQDKSKQAEPKQVESKQAEPGQVNPGPSRARSERAEPSSSKAKGGN